jgi:hypothetical protein
VAGRGRYGRKRTVLIGLLGSAFSILIFGTAKTYTQVRSGCRCCRPMVDLVAHRAPVSPTGLVLLARAHESPRCGSYHARARESAYFD